MQEIMSGSSTPRIIVGALVVSGLGHVIHNLQEFPITILFGWETLFPLAVTVLLGVTWYRGPARTTYAAMAGWAAIVIVFGGGSVIPFRFLPFVPEQSVAHYAAHVVYAVTQLPLLWVGLQGFRSDRPDSTEANPDQANTQ